MYQLTDKKWQDLLNKEFQENYMLELENFLIKEYAEQTIYPEKKDIFRALDLTPYDDVKVLILGQDPYHGKDQANGLSFSVTKETSIPPSLRNIFKEMEDDLNISAPTFGDLTPWAKQGVLLLNTVLTVRDAKAHSHKGQGWEKFTDKIIELVNEKDEHVVFVLWGKPAQKKVKMINQDKHTVLCAPHPSPLSSYRGFFGSAPFSKINLARTNHNQDTIDWSFTNSL